MHDNRFVRAERIDDSLHRREDIAQLAFALFQPRCGRFESYEFGSAAGDVVSCPRDPRERTLCCGRFAGSASQYFLTKVRSFVCFDITIKSDLSVANSHPGRTLLYYH